MAFHASFKRNVPHPLSGQGDRLRHLLTTATAHPSFALMRLPWAGSLIATLARPKRPPVLLVSLPRAGSSWIGHILGGSDRALYLREPMTQSYLKRVGREKATSFFEMAMCHDRRAYEGYAALAFKGIPRFPQTIVQYPEQWAIAERSRRQVVIKEVNPLAIEHFWELYKPKVVFLLRHPVPVARSFDALGWTGDKFRNAFHPNSLAEIEKDYVFSETADVWERGGAFHAIIHNRVMGFLDKVDHTVLRYEDVCENPLEEFVRVFDFCGLPLSADLRQEIERSSHAHADYSPGLYDTDRNSSDMKDRWKREVSPEVIERVRRSYFANRPIFYTDERDW